MQWTLVSLDGPQRSVKFGPDRMRSFRVADSSALQLFALAPDASELARALEQLHEPK